MNPAPDQGVAIEELLAHEEWVRRLASRLVRDPSVADELVQRTFLAALVHPPHHASAPRAWLGRVLRNAAHRLQREERTRAGYEQATEQPEAPETAEELATRMEIQQKLAGLVLSLEEPFRSTLLLRYYGDVPAVEIARRQEVPAGTVRWRCKRGLELLREELDQRNEGERSTWVRAMIVGVGIPSARKVGEATAETSSPLLGLPTLIGAALIVLTAVLAWRFSGSNSSEADSLPESAAIAATDELPRDDASERIEVSRPDALDAQTAVMPAGRELLVIVKDERGLRVRDAEVHVMGAGGSMIVRGMTDREGELQLRVQSADLGHSEYFGTAGLLSLRANAPGHSTSMLHHVPYPPPEGTAPLTLTLSTESFELAGLVIDSEGLPIAGAHVAFGPRGVPPQMRPSPGHVVTQASHVAITDLQGRFELTHLPLALSSVWISAPGYLQWRSNILGKDSERLERRFPLERAARASGRVLGPAGAPRAGVHVFYDPLSSVGLRERTRARYIPRLFGFSELTTTDAEGRFQLASLPPGKLRLWAYDPESPSEVVEELLHVQLTEAAIWEPWLSEHEALDLRVLDMEGAPLAGWSVLLTTERALKPEWRRWFELPEDGRVELFDAPRGEAILARVYAPDEDALPRALAAGLVPSDEPLELRLSVELTDESLLRIRFDFGGGAVPAGTLRLFDASGRGALAARIEGDLVEGSLRAGRYTIDARFPRLGLIPLGEQELRPGVQLDLGLVRAPELARLNFSGDWKELAADASWSWTLTAFATPGSEVSATAAIAAGPEAPRDEYRVLPGWYRYLILRDGFTASERWVELAPGGEAHFGVLPLAERHLPIELALENGSAEEDGAFHVLVTRLDGPKSGEPAFESSLAVAGPLTRTFLPLSSGMYAIEVETDSGRYAAREIAIDPRATQSTLRFELE